METKVGSEVGYKGEAKMVNSNGSVTLAVVSSKSRPGVEYKLVVGRDNQLYCSCPAWKYSRGTKNCKHLDQFLGKKN